MLCEKCGRKVCDDETFCAKCAKGTRSKENAAVSSGCLAGSLYTHSGRVSTLLILGVPLVLVISILLAFVYAYAVVYIPFFGYLSFILTLGFALGIGYSTAVILRFFKTRNTVFAAVFGFFSGLFALYAAWVTFEYVLSARYSAEGEGLRLLSLAFDPVRVWEVACYIAEKGWYSISKMTPKGAVLWTFWAVEALAIVGCSTYMAYSFIKEVVFCEVCNAWTKNHGGQLEFEYLSENELKEKLVQHDLSFLKDIIKVKRTDSEFYRISCTMCGVCKNLFTLSLLRIVRSWDNEGKETEKKTPVLRNLVISKELFERLTSFKQSETADVADASEQAAAEAEAAANEAEAAGEEDTE